MVKKRTIRKSTAKPPSGFAEPEPAAPTTDIGELVQGFATHIKYYKSAKTKEAEVRLRFIDPFWRALGWTIGDPTVKPADAEVIIEKSVEVADAKAIHNRRPDYIFRLSGFPRFVVEAKKPAVDLDSNCSVSYHPCSFTPLVLQNLE